VLHTLFPAARCTLHALRFLFLAHLPPCAARSFAEDQASMRVLLLGELMAGADFRRDNLYVE